MLSEKYSEAAAEVLDILEHMEKEDYDKIPSKFIFMLEENAAKDYVCELDYTKRLMDMNLRQETKSLLGVMYRNYWCPEDKIQEFEDKLSENEKKFQEELREKYNSDNIFGNSNTNVDLYSTSSETISSSINSEENSLTEMEEKSIFQKILNKIISIFKRK